MFSVAYRFPRSCQTETRPSLGCSKRHSSLKRSFHMALLTLFRTLTILTVKLGFDTLGFFLLFFCKSSDYVQFAPQSVFVSSFVLLKLFKKHCHLPKDFLLSFFNHLQMCWRSLSFYFIGCPDRTASSKLTFLRQFLHNFAAIEQ